jgi:hypothetical protein
MKSTICCRYCKHAPAWVYNAAGRIKNDRGGKCRWTWPEVAVPWSIQGERLPQPRYVYPEEGVGCRAFELRGEG